MRSQGGEGGRHTSAPRNDSTNDLGEPGKSKCLSVFCVDGLGSDFLFTFVFVFTLIFFYFRFFFLALFLAFYF